MLIYLAQLTHINNGVPATEIIPLNIGYLASYGKKVFGNQVEIRLFNLHTDLNEAIKERKPHMLGAGSYSWNSNLAYHYLSYYKKQYPEMVTVMGGPFFPNKPELRQDFLIKRKLLDFYVYGEGESGFSALIQACLTHNMDIDKIKKEGVNGCHYLMQDKLMSGSSLNRIKDLDTIPSPYLEGLLDEFLEKGFAPIIQSNRGCPFSCAYCCSSTEYYNQVNFFSVDRVKKEIEYIAKKARSSAIHVHDDNFAMFQHDSEICQKFKEVQQKYGWPIFIGVSTGKNARRHIIRCIEILGSSINLSLSVQSTNKDVLKNIKRENIDLSDYWCIQKRIKELGMDTLCELIMPLPGETLDSHLEGIKMIMSIGVDFISPYTTMLLPASPLSEKEDYDKFQMVRKYRTIPRDFGKYDGTNVVEVEEVCVATKDLSFDDYLFIRKFHYIIYCYYNGETFKEIIHYLKSLGIEVYDFCYALLSYTDITPEIVRKTFENFLSDTIQELWDSKEDIHHYYKKDANLNKLLQQVQGYNLLQRYHGLFFSSHFNMFLEYAMKVATRLLNEKDIDYDKKVLESIFSYILNSRNKIFDIVDADITAELDYDVHTWRQEGFKKPILEYNNKTRLKFLQTEKQKKIIHEYTKICGDTEDSKGKILTRVNPKVLFREILSL